jgi:hypothetical protein
MNLKNHLKNIKEQLKKGQALFLSSVSKRSEPFSCYEIWRPNIPYDGCKTQCKECKEKQNNCLQRNTNKD